MVLWGMGFAAPFKAIITQGQVRSEFGFITSCSAFLHKTSYSGDSGFIITERTGFGVFPIHNSFGLVFQVEGAAPAVAGVIARSVWCRQSVKKNVTRLHLHGDGLAFVK